MKIKKELKNFYSEYRSKPRKNSAGKNITFESFLLESWVNDPTYTGARKRTKKMGLHVERCIYELPQINKFKTFLIAKEQKLYKQKISEEIKITYI